MSDQSIFLGKSEKAERLSLKYANRHGLISGATGTGKTVTLQIMAEGFSDAGVPVFVADVKGDLSGLGQPIVMKDFLQKRADTIELDPYTPRDFPVCFWDLFGKKGHPIRATVSEMGPLLLSRLLDLNDTQEGVLTLAFRLADDEGLLLLDLKDLRALLVEIAERAKELSAEYGHVSRASVGAIQRRLLALEEQGAENFFGEPALDLMDFLRTDDQGAGIVNILAADKLMHTPKLYATFLLWLLSELFEELPEIGDPEKPKLVFFFDEAHLLFDDAPKALLQKVEQVVRLIRSKGVGVFFVTQNPLDVPDSVSSQLGNRVQHALRAYTPREQRVVKAAAETFRPNPAFKTLDVIKQLGIGEALVSTLMSKGAPGIVERTLIRPPSSRMGPLTAAERKDIMRYSDMADKYDTPVDRQSAYEDLKTRAEKKAKAAEKAAEKAKKTSSKARSTKARSRRSNRQSVGEAAFKTAARTLARELVRGILGSLKRR
ncbi:helicase HerA-like domain-containing protein [Hyphococcus lacteus]|uniref:Helicase HerA-like domain-containing protein n=1 Tax=Hyphococcus lacteus TaxID=3143536 RepID=A0ABV3Z6I1_9PROT